jgi:hypothetical protein
MNRLFLISAAAVLLSVNAASTLAPARADTLLMDRAHMSESMAHSMRGMSMGKVRQRLGEPARKLDRRGGQKPQWPVIDRWEYSDYTVYFARGRLVDIVLNHASPSEMGPAPAH